MSIAKAIECRFRLDYPRFSLDVDQQLPGSGVTVLFGHSGSGKTTLLRCIAGLEKAQQAFLKVNDEVWDDSKQGIHLPAHKRQIAYVFQEASLFPHLSVRGNLDYGRQRVKRAQPNQINTAASLSAIIELLGIGHLLERMPAKLSGGERQRVAIARALAVAPQLLLMDEPLAALDMQRKREILPFLIRLHHELQIPVLYITHSPQEVTQLADYILLLEAGKVVTAGTLQAVLTRIDLPLARGNRAASVLEVIVEEHCTEDCLTLVSFAGGQLRLPSRGTWAIGSRLRLRIYARDVSLSLERATQSSILNILPATISAMADEGEGRVVLRLDLQGVALLAHVTQFSQKRLNLQVGMPVFAQIKATAVL